MKRRQLLCQVLLLSLIIFACADGIQQKTGTEAWSQFRGPNGSGVNETTGLPTEFGPDKNVVWKTELPTGYSSPVFTKEYISS